MSGEFWAFLGVVVTAIGSLIGVIYSTNKKNKAEQLAVLTASITKIEDEQKAFLKETREEVSKMQDFYAEKISEVNMSMQDLRGQLQQAHSETSMRIDFMTKEFTDMKTEVREHNNFAKRMPIVEHRIGELEEKLKHE